MDKNSPGTLQDQSRHVCMHEETRPLSGSFLEWLLKQLQQFIDFFSPSISKWVPVLSFVLRSSVEVCTCVSVC